VDTTPFKMNIGMFKTIPEKEVEVQLSVLISE